MCSGSFITNNLKGVTRKIKAVGRGQVYRILRARSEAQPPPVPPVDIHTCTSRPIFISIRYQHRDLQVMSRQYYSSLLIILPQLKIKVNFKNNYDRGAVGQLPYLP